MKRFKERILSEPTINRKENISTFCMHKHIVEKLHLSKIIIEEN